MDFLNYLDKLNIDYIIVFLVILSGFFQAQYMAGLTWAKKQSFDGALKTLVVSFFACLLYTFLIHLDDKTVPIPYAKYFISYFTATSLYQLIVEPIASAIKSWIKKKTGSDSTPLTPPPTE